MDSHAYQLLALGARYLFIFWAALIVLRAGLSLLREHKKRRKILRNLPDAGMVGEMRDMDSGKAYPLPREGVLGSGRGCDIRLRGLKRRHVNFTFVDGKGLLLTPCHHRGEVLLDGDPIRKGGYALHGACMQAGAYQLRIRLFAGLNVPRAAAFTDHWQPVYDEELYAPDYTQFTPVQSMYAPYSPDAVPYMHEDDPLPPVFEPEEPCAPVIQETPYYPPMQPIAPAVYDNPQETEDMPLPFDTGMYAPSQEEDPISAARPPRRRRSERNRQL